VTSFFVPGRPVPQGSLAHKGRGKLGDGERLLRWRGEVIMAARAAGIFGVGRPGAFYVKLRYLYARPAELAERFPIGHGYADLDKLVRAVLDALTEVVWTDDRQVVRLEASKEWSAGDGPGVWIDVDVVA
jgi:crossover junction endodeoxyribonuclease RusA